MPHFLWETLLGDEEAHGLIDKVTMSYDEYDRLKSVKYYREDKLLFEKQPIWENNTLKKVNILVDGIVKFTLVLTYEEGKVVQIVTERV